MKKILYSRYILGLVLAGVLAISGCAGKDFSPKGERGGLDLVILHTNDTHSHVAGIDKYGNASFDESKSRGGLARISAAIRNAKAEKDNVIALDAGDQFQGTLFFSVNKWRMLSELNEHMPWDAMTLGNHEFDEGCHELAKFMETIKFPIVAANLAPLKGCPLLKSNYVPHVILTVRGQKVGVVGIANDEVVGLSAACSKTRFADRVETLKKQVAELEAQGVKHIIALTHIGLPDDRALARAVDGVDIVVGGHTHSYLGPDSPEGPYPIVEKTPNGDPVLVVTAKRAAQYLGELNVSFDANGVLTKWSGSAVELANDAPRDPAISAIIQKYAQSLDSFRNTIIGSHSVDLPDGMDLCREGECFGGLLMTDAMLDFGRQHGASVAICNGGGMRAALPRGKISRGDILTTFPFGNMYVLREVSGEQLWEALENGVSEEGAKGPRLLHVAGMRYWIDGTRPSGSRIVKAEVIDEKGQAKPLDLKARYVIIVSDYIVHGGDNFTMFGDAKAVPSPDPIDVDLLERYILKASPIKAIQTGRINRMK